MIKSFFILCFFTASVFLSAATWNSKTTGASITYTVSEALQPAKDAAGKYMTVVYLKNLNIPLISKNTNVENVNWLLEKGYRVIELDYQKNELSVATAINQDIIEINDAVAAGSFCGMTDCSTSRSYVLFEGYRIARDIAYFKDNPLIYNYPSYYTEGDSLYMDVIYPANSKAEVPTVISFSYSNSTYLTKHQRLNLGYTLSGFNDSFLEGAPAHGVAWVIADHPKYCDWGQGKPVGGANKAYASFQVNPDAAQKVKSAIRTIRARSEEFNLSGKIGIYGFSRGSDAGSMAIGDRADSVSENAGLHIGVSDEVQAAALGSGVFDFTQIFNTINDGDSNLESKCPVVWGPLADNYQLWNSMGSAYYVQSAATAPVLFFYNTDDSPYYQDQIAHFKAKLDSIGVSTTVIKNYGTAHAVPQTVSSLTNLYDFFRLNLTPPDLNAINDTILTTLSQNADKSVFQVLKTNEGITVNFEFITPAIPFISVYDLSGKLLVAKSTEIISVGKQSVFIPLTDLMNSIYVIKLETGNSEYTKKL